MAVLVAASGRGPADSCPRRGLRPHRVRGACAAICDSGGWLRPFPRALPSGGLLVVTAHPHLTVQAFALLIFSERAAPDRRCCREPGLPHALPSWLWSNTKLAKRRLELTDRFIARTAGAWEGFVVEPLPFLETALRRTWWTWRYPRSPHGPSSTSSRVAARSPKISRISAVRSSTLAPVSFSRLRCWIGESARVDEQELDLLRLHPLARCPRRGRRR